MGAAMSTKRTPLARPLQYPISETALRAFRHMCRLESQCTCAPRDWDGEYWKHEQCKACAEWWKQNSILHDALKLRPWQWPAIEKPGDREPVPCWSASSRSTTISKIPI
jgi:hypothetical protein